MLSLTQKQMAQKLGISKQAYWNKENGVNSFTDKEKVVFKEILIPYFPSIKIDDIFFTDKELRVERRVKDAK